MATLTGPDIQPGIASSTSTITVRPLQPTIGAEIGGVDLRQPLGTTARDEIKAAILQYKVVFFRDQDLDRDQHAASARQFGPLYVHPVRSRSGTTARRRSTTRCATTVSSPGCLSAS